MDQDIISTEEKELQEALLNIPEEVRSFIWSDAFGYIIDTAEKVIPLSKEEKTSMKLAAYKILLRTSTMEKLGEEMVQEGIDKEKVLKILYIIDTQIVTTAKNIIENSTEEEDQRPSPESNTDSTQAPSPIQAMAMIKDRLTGPSSIAPTKRDYSAEKVADPTVTSTPTTSIRSIDPYRELPEKE
jgi:hypothetical protein